MAPKDKMNGDLLTNLSMDNNNRLSTILSMDSIRAVDLDLTLPPDINLPPSPSRDSCDSLDAGLGSQHYGTETHINVTKIGKKCAKRVDNVWGAWFFFNFYFKPAINENSKKVKLDVFLVQHDMENMYMWAFKDRPENALGKMQLRSYMNGHSRQGEKPFPFCPDKGFVRSHRMQRKHYRGLSNPQCVHGIEVVRSPNLTGLDEEERRRWMELTGRDLNFSITLEACDFGSWRSVSSTDFEIERPLAFPNSNGNNHRTRLNGTSFNHGMGMDILAGCNNKRRKNLLNEDENSDGVVDTHHIEPHWLSGFTGVLKGANGPVTGAKAIYEDEEGFLIMVSLPCVDLQRVKVTWRNNSVQQGVVKISCVSIGCMPIVKRQNRTFKLCDPAPEHCPPGEFVREIVLPLAIPLDAKLEAYGDETGTMLEIIVPKHSEEPEEHEVRVCLRSLPWTERSFVDFAESSV